MVKSNYQQLPKIPELMTEYRSAMKDMLPVIGTKHVAKDNPSTAFEVQGHHVDRTHLAHYCQATELRLGNELPLTYPYVLSFPIVMKVLTAPDFPFGAVGAVHLSNVIEQHRPLRVEDALDIRVHAENLREHKKGLLIDLVTEVQVEGSLAWRQVSSFLSKGSKLSSSSPLAGGEKTNGIILEAEKPADPRPTAAVRVTPGEIKTYAEASGDKNPIHVSAVGAKAFGFPNVIAHGMWSAARMLSVLEGRLPQKARYSVQFYRPVVLPTTVAVFTESDGAGGWEIQMRKASKLDTVHAAATVEQL